MSKTKVSDILTDSIIICAKCDLTMFWHKGDKLYEVVFDGCENLHYDYENLQIVRTIKDFLKPISNSPPYCETIDSHTLFFCPACAEKYHNQITKKLEERQS